MSSERFAQLKERAELRGIELISVTNEHGRPVYAASPVHWTKELGSLDQVEGFLNRESQGFTVEAGTVGRPIGGPQKAGVL